MHMYIANIDVMNFSYYISQAMSPIKTSRLPNCQFKFDYPPIFLQYCQYHDEHPIKKFAEMFISSILLKALISVAVASTAMDNNIIMTY